MSQPIGVLLHNIINDVIHYYIMRLRDRLFGARQHSLTGAHCREPPSLSGQPSSGLHNDWLEEGFVSDESFTPLTTLTSYLPWCSDLGFQFPAPTESQRPRHHCSQCSGDGSEFWGPFSPKHDWAVSLYQLVQHISGRSGPSENVFTGKCRSLWITIFFLLCSVF